MVPRSISPFSNTGSLLPVSQAQSRHPHWLVQRLSGVPRDVFAFLNNLEPKLRDFRNDLGDFIERQIKQKTIAAGNCGSSYIPDQWRKGVGIIDDDFWFHGWPV